LNVLFVTGEYPPMRGGVGDFTREIAQEFVRVGDLAHVLTSASMPRHASVEDGVHVHRTMPGWGWATARRVSALAHNARADVINLQYQAAAYAMHPAINLLTGLRVGRGPGKARAPFVVTFHDLRVPYLFPKAGPLRKRIVYRMARSASAVIVTNEEDQAELRAQSIPARVIPIGSNVRRILPANFSAAAWKSAHGIPPTRKIFGYFGFMNESKGGELLISALNRMVGRQLDVGLLFVGEQLGASDPTNAGYRTGLNGMIDALHLRDRVTQTGYLNDEGVSAAFAACECLALPYVDGVSLRRGTFMAALANGCAVVTTTPRAPISLLDDTGNVLLVPPGDPAALAGALETVMSNPGLHARLQRGARDLNQYFQWKSIAAATRELFVSL
jgi:glycosyltransferase involved in cell wall biosynthesis